MRRRRVWVETLPFATLCDPRVMRLLRQYEIDVILAVRPTSLGELPKALDVLAGEGIEASIWPMLEDGEGRWASARNAEAFSAFARKVADAVDPRERAELVVDLEPPIDDVRVLLSGLRGVSRLAAHVSDGAVLSQARNVYEGLVRDFAARGIVTSAVAVPMVLLDHGTITTSPWQTLLGTPLDGPSWRGVNVMLYTSILEGWSRGLLDRRRTEGVLAAACRTIVARYGEEGGVSLGAVGTGAFGDEPVYRSPAELARDVSIARACGLDDLALFDLGGVLARRPAEAWLEAFVTTEAAGDVPGYSLRARVAFSVATIGTASLGPLARLIRKMQRVSRKDARSSHVLRPS